MITAGTSLVLTELFIDIIAIFTDLNVIKHLLDKTVLIIDKISK